MQQKKHKFPRMFKNHKRIIHVIVVISIVTISLYSIKIIRDLVLHNYVEQQLVQANTLQTEVDNWIDDRLNLIDIYQVLISNLQVTDFKYTRTENKYLKIDYMQHQVDAIYCGLEDGWFASGRDWIPDATYDPRVRPWYVGAQLAGTTYIGDTYIDVDTKKAVFTVSKALKTRDGVAGVVAIDIYMDTIALKIKKLILDTDFEAAIIDNQGVVLHYTGDEYLAGQNIEAYTSSKIYNLYKKYKSQNTGEQLLEIKNKHLTMIGGIEMTPWTLIVFTNDENALLNTETDMQPFYVSSGLLIILAIASLLIYMRNSNVVEVKQSRLEIDGLTKVFSRSYMDEKLEIFYDLALNEKEMLSIILIDVDYFRKYTNKYGKVAADDLLVKISREMMKQMDPRFVMARYGGDVFAVICYQTDQNAARKIAGDIVSMVTALSLPHEGTPQGIVTVSVGVTSITPNETISIGMFLHTGFDALMSAKAAGRNTSRSL